MNEWVAGIFAALMGVLSFGAAAPDGFTGYLEADYVYTAPVSGGVLDSIAVAEGDSIAKGATLFVLRSAQQEALVRAADARVEATRATLDNLVTGSRSAEIDVIRANLSKAEADLALAQSTFTRSQKLFDAGSAPQAQLDQNRAALSSAQAQVAQLNAQVAVAELPARDAQQVAAEANLNAAVADAEGARLNLDDRTVLAPVAGVVDDVFFSAGEMVAPGAPVLSIRPEGEIKARFYVGEAERAKLAVGQRVSIACDSCADGVTGRISTIGAEPQTTPPVIYSRDQRARLVFVAEAVLDQAGTLMPGQPVTVKALP
ncbi:MAG TPA: HlyD family efflux transporter periplasmic adaptor subunit [Devosia sp.]|nr:HlyD family efflux transporter periplasmic adaptor subunit [Devosia sp.]